MSDNQHPISRLLRRIAGRIGRLIAYLRADRHTRRYYWAGGNYRWIFDYLARDGVGPSNPGALIVEVGSRDCLDAIELYQHFAPARVYAFEPSHPGIARCREVLQEFPAQADFITLCTFALGKRNGTALFYEFTLPETGGGRVNIGASSLYPWTSRKLPADNWAKDIERIKPVQRSYPVQICRADDLDFLKQQAILLMVLDVEGAEMQVLQGAEAVLRQTRYLCLEVGYHAPREGDVPDAPALVAYLAMRGWELIACNATGAAMLPADPGQPKQFDLLLRNTARGDAAA